ncbi:universal stress protein family [Streptococcus agalactiae H36B]|nr:universal stress protein family [Streptococcus agalactiae H36B]
MSARGYLFWLYLEEDRLMSQKYERILVAIDGITESELAFEKAVNVALRNDSE